mmetsp:Transcript_23023/g.28256  ORF Transcript_23023/g.28256 Transcript_23023/m.28256 type:complete len:83 (+) Transcript_23023:40-288(+)
MTKLVSVFYVTELIVLVYSFCGQNSSRMEGIFHFDAHLARYQTVVMLSTMLFFTLPISQTFKDTEKLWQIPGGGFTTTQRTV